VSRGATGHLELGATVEVGARWCEPLAFNCVQSSLTKKSQWGGCDMSRQRHVWPQIPNPRREIMTKQLSLSLLRNVLVVGAVTLAPLTAAQATSPLGFDIPDPVAGGGHGPMHSDTLSAGPAGISPLGFELPAPAPRGAQGPVRSETASYGAADQSWLRRLAGIGGSDTF
jgi:hypothetical protein